MIARLLPFVAVLALASAGAGSGVAPPALTIGRQMSHMESRDPSVARAFEVDVNVGVLVGLQTGGRFQVSLPGARSVTIVVERVSNVVGGRAIRGRLETHPTGEATFVLTAAGALNGVMSADGLGTWRIRPSAGAHVLVEVDPARLPACAGTPPVVESDVLPGAARGGEPLCEDGTRVDVLILYTPVARADAGGQAAIEGEINLAVEAANAAYDNSEIGHHLRVVGLQEIGYDESGSYNDHLNRLTDGSDGFMDEAHALREELAADLVALIVADGEYCGVAWLMPENSTDSEDRGFSVTTWYCAANLVLAHELGHNMGACHAPGDGGGCSTGGLYEYSVGYRYFGDSGTQWRTVMAYAPGSRIGHFSNPEIDFDGRPTGIGSADNGRTLNETTLAIANYRRPPCAGNAYDDCAVDFLDVLKLLANWGQSGGPSDVNGDGTVDVQDLLFVLQHWGPCVYG